MEGYARGRGRGGHQQCSVVHVGEAILEGPVLVCGQQTVSEREAKQARQEWYAGARYADETSAAVNSVADETHQFLERGALRTNRIDDLVDTLGSRLHGETREVVHMNRTDSVVAGSSDAEDRKPPQ